METEATNDPVQMGVADDVPCDVCGNDTRRCGGFRDEYGAAYLSVCQWCLAVLLSEVTGFGVVTQLMAWESTRSRAKSTAWRAFRQVMPATAGSPTGQ